MSTLLDLVAMTVSSAFGTGAIIPLGSPAVINGTTYLSYATAGAAGGNAVIYSILDSSASEIGTATYTSSNTTLTSRTPTKSTNGNATINGSSAAIVMATIRAEDLPQLGAANVFTATQQATVFQPTQSASVAWGVDFHNISMTIAASSLSTLATGAGLILITDGSQTGATGIYVTGGSAVTLVSQSSGAGTTGSPFTTSSTPGSSRYSIAFSGGVYNVYNGSSNSIQFFVATVMSRNAA